MYAVPAAIRAVRRLLPSGGVRRPGAEQLVLGWSGMRGALSLAAALSLPLSRPYSSLAETRGILIFLSFAAIFVTLVLPGLTLAPLIRFLGLGQRVRHRRQSAEARLQVVRAALTRLEDIAGHEEVSRASVARLRDLYETRMAALEQVLGEHEPHDLAEDLREETRPRSQLLDAQRNALTRLVAERAAPPDVPREIMRELDLEAARFGGV